MLGIGLALVTTAWAQQVDIVIDEELAQQVGLDADEVREEIRAATDGKLKLDAPQEFLAQMATANAFATKGMGVDYASNPQRFFVGAAVGSAVNGVGFSFEHGDGELPTGGFAFQVSGNAGLNLGLLSKDESFLRRLVLSVNGLWGQGLSGPFDATLYNAGAHLQIKLIRPPHEGIVEWGGLDLTGGYELSSYQLKLSQALPVAANDYLRWDAEGRFDIVAESHTIPIELSTNLRVFVVSAYVGGAVDLRRVAYATGEVELGGPVIAEAQGQEKAIGSVSATYGAKGDTATQYAPRVFAGAQINIVWVKLYGHLNVGFDDTYAGHLGLRVAL